MTEIICGTKIYYSLIIQPISMCLLVLTSGIMWLLCFLLFISLPIYFDMFKTIFTKLHILSK